MSAPLFAWLLIHALSSRPSDQCVFCTAHSTHRDDFEVVWEDTEFFAFRDRFPAGRHHIQLIPKVHISSVKKLTHDDVDMVRRMQSVGHDILDKLQVPPTHRKMGFHIPPFNSIQHLHLHVLALPYASRIHKLKYPVVKGFAVFDKGFSWFCEVGQTIRILDKGSNVTTFPC